MFFNKAAIKHWQKLACTLSKFVASLPHCRDCKSRDFKITFVELFYVVYFQWFELVSQKKTVDHFYIDVKRLCANADASVCFFNRNEISCVSPKISRLLS